MLWLEPRETDSIHKKLFVTCDLCNRICDETCEGCPNFSKKAVKEAHKRYWEDNGDNRFAHSKQSFAIISWAYSKREVLNGLQNN